MTRKCFILSALTSLLLAASCSKVFDSPGSAGGSTVEIVLSTQSATKADYPANGFDVNEFQVELINQQGVIFKRWSTFAECKGTKIPMNVGTFKVRALYGDSTEVGFNAFYFIGEETFEVRQGENNSTVSVVCKPGNSKVAVEWGPNVAENYRDWSVDVYNIEHRTKHLVFEKTTDEAGYIISGQLALRVDLVDMNGNVTSRYSNPFKAAPADFLTLKLDSGKLPDGGITLDFSVDYGTNDIGKDIELPGFLLPSDAPTLNDNQSFATPVIEGTVDGERLDVSLSAPGKIAECVLTINSGYLNNVLGLPATVDLVNTPADVKAQLTAAGLEWTNLLGAELGLVNFKKLSSKIPYDLDNAAANEHNFSISLVDETGKPATASYKLVIKPAEISIENVSNSDTWSHSTIVTLVAVKGSAVQLYPEVSKDGVNWTVPAYTSSVSGRNAVCTVSGLDAGQAYKVRGRYYNHATETVKSFTTEGASQVLNAGFEDYHYVDKTKQGVFMTHRWRIYYPWAENASASQKGWGGNFDETTAAPGTDGYTAGKCMFSTYYEGGAHSGSKTAVMRNVWIGSTSSAISIGATGLVKTCGKLWLSNDGSSEGRSHNDRPTKISFWYKYAPYDTDYCKAYAEVLSGSTVIATGEFSTGSSISAWSQATISLSYSRTDLKATSVRLKFQSSTASEPPVKKLTDETINGVEYNDCHLGSKFSIDDVLFVYEK